MVFDRELFLEEGGFDETLRYYPDLDLWLRLLLRRDGIFTRQALVGFRVHSSSLTGPNQKLAFSEWLRVYNKFAVAVGLSVPAPRGLRIRNLLIGTLRGWVISILS
ncbi:MAG: hypothetical protein Fur0032_14610 [Terrimicrobiaceae bacterium]